MAAVEFDCGIATPEAYNDATKAALHILNVNFIGELNRNRAVKFVVARILHFDRHLPQGSSQHVRFDLRGQLISNKNLESARQAILSEAAKHKICVAVDFLTN